MKETESTLMEKGIEKVNKRVLIVEDERTNLYIIDSVRSKFDEIIVLSEYLKPTSELSDYETNRLPKVTYSPDITQDSSPYYKTKVLTNSETKQKETYVATKFLDLGENNAYFLVGKKVWYYLRDFMPVHIGLRNTNLDWQVPHLKPFTMGTNKFVLCHSMQDEFYTKHSEYFFDDNILFNTVKPLREDNRKVITEFEGIMTATQWALEQPVGTNFGLDYETNGLWKYDKYEDIRAIGVGIATKEFGFYLEFRRLTETQLNEFKDLYRKFLDKHVKNIWVFNVDFELMMTRKFLGPWAVYDFKDVDIFRIIDGNQVGYSSKVVEDRKYRGDSPKYKTVKVNRDQYWSLKFTAQMMLKVGSWDNDFEEVESKLFNIFKGFQHDNIEDFLRNPIVGHKFHEWVEKGLFNEASMTKLLRNLSAWKKMNSKEAIQSAFPKGLEYLAEELYVVILGCETPEQVRSHPYWIELLEKYPEHADEFTEWMEHPDYFGQTFAMQPSEIVGTYCILDSYYTVMCAEKFIEEDRYTNNPVASADWANTQVLIDVFAANKCLGAKLSLYGLYKDNDKRMRYKDINDKVRVFANHVIASGYLQLLLDDDSLKPHENEQYLHPIFKSTIKFGGNPMDFGRVTKLLFQKIYDPESDKGWNEELANEYLGDAAEELKSIMLDHKPGGFVNKSAHSRAINMHKETAVIVENLWNEQDLPEGFDWKLCQPYYTKLSKLGNAGDKLRRLRMSSIEGKHIDEVMKMDRITMVLQEVVNKKTVDVEKEFTFNEAVSIIKKHFFDIKPQSEIALGQLTEKWKDYKALLFLYHPFEYKKIIDRANIFSIDEPLEDKVSKFHEYMRKVINEYNQPNLSNWEKAWRFAVDNDFPDNLKNPEPEVQTEALQESAYIDAVISEDLNRQYGLDKNVLDQYVFYMSVDRKMIEEKKAYLLETKHMNPISYKNWIQEVNKLAATHDNLISGDYDSNETLKELMTATVDINEDHAYVKIGQLFKLYRKTDKINSYPDGQLVASDLHYLGEDEDGVPMLAGLTKEARENNAVGNNVKMFPKYEIMQKLSKRTSTGIHTVPSRSEIKGIISAPEDSFLVYTDISSLELRGISAISGDPVMENLFDEGKDIYTTAAYNYHVDILGKDMTYAEVWKAWRRQYKGGVISSIYGAGDWTLSTFYEVPPHEVKHITNALFSQFKQLKKWQEAQLEFVKLNNGQIRTWLGDRRVLVDASRAKFQAVNLEVQGTSSVIGATGFGNLFVAANERKMYLTPAISVHDAIIAYAKAKDIELLYDHYQEHFYNFLAKNYRMKLPFDLEIACNYFDKIVMEKGKNPREYNVSGSNKSVYTVLQRAINNGKEIEFLDPEINMDVVKSRIDSNYNPIEGAAKNGGNPTFEKDFSYGNYDIRFID